MTFTKKFYWQQQTCLATKHLHTKQKEHGPWWWCSGYRARLMIHEVVGSKLANHWEFTKKRKKIDVKDSGRGHTIFV